MDSLSTYLEVTAQITDADYFSLFHHYFYGLEVWGRKDLLYNPEISAAERRERAIKSLIAVGLGERLNHKSNQMSGGQQQRVAIARALVNDPVIILADEATGNLDTRTSFSVLVLFQELYRKGRTIIFVTHNPELAAFSSRNIVLRDGKIISDTLNPSPASAKEMLESLPSDDE